MTTRIGRVEFDVDLDGSTLPRQARRIGRKVGQEMGDGANSEFSSRTRKGMESLRAQVAREGRRTGRLYGRRFIDEVDINVKRRARGISQTLARAISTREGWQAFVREVGGADEAMRRLEASVEQLRREEIKLHKVREDGKKQAYWAKVLPKKDADRVLRTLREWGAETKAQEERQKALNRENERMLIDLDRLKETIGSRETFRRYARDIGHADTATGRLRNRLEALRRESVITEREFARLSDRLERQVVSYRENRDAAHRLPSTISGVARAVRRVGDELPAPTRRLNRFSREARSATRQGNLFTRMLGRLGTRLRNFGNRGDMTPRILVAIILTLGESIATLGSGLGASLTALASSFSLAVGGMGVALSGFLGTIVLAIPYISSFWTSLSSDHGIDLMKEFNKAFNDAGSAIANNLLPNVQEFIGILREFAGDQRLIEGMTKVIGSAFEALNKAMRSEGIDRFMTAIQGPIGDGFLKLGEAIGSVIDGMGALSAAAGPLFEMLMTDLANWAEQWAEKMNLRAATGGFDEFFEKARESIHSLLGLLDAVGDMLGVVFLAGADSGNRLLDTLTGVFRGWTDWMQTVEGQRALEEWFANGEKIMGAFGDLLVDVGKMFAQVVTPESIDRIVEFMDRLGDMMPGLGEIMTLFGELDILNLVAVALQTIGSLLKPMMPTLHELADIFAVTLKDAMTELQPSFERLGDALIPIIENIVDLAVKVLPPLVDILGVVIEWIAGLIDIVMTVDGVLSDFGFGTEAVRDLVAGSFEHIANVVDLVFGSMSDIFNAAIALIEGDLSGAFDFFKSFVERTLGAVGLEFEGVKKWMGNLLATFKLDFNDINSILRGFGDTIARIFGGAIGWIKDIINWFGRLTGAASSASGAVSGARGAGGGGGPQRFASGKMVTGPVRALIGEAGPEAVVPLRRPLGQVDPSVRWLSAIAQGKSAPPMASGGVAGGGRTVNVEAGAIVVQEAHSPIATSVAILDRFTENVD